MPSYKIRGVEYEIASIKDSHNRRAVQIQNKILDALSHMNLTEDDCEIPLEKMALKKAPASVSWYFEGYHLHFSYELAPTFADNLNVVFHVIHHEIGLLLTEKRTIEEFIKEFSEDKEVKGQRIEARKVLGLSETELDWTVIDKKFKELSRECHPDMPNGDMEQFKSINRAHKILKRELG